MVTQSCQECWCSEVNTELSGDIKVNPLWIFFFFFILTLTELSLRGLISWQRQRSGVWGSPHCPPDATVGWRPGHVLCAEWPQQIPPLGELVETLPWGSEKSQELSVCWKLGWRRWGEHPKNGWRWALETGSCPFYGFYVVSVTLSGTEQERWNNDLDKRKTKDKMFTGELLLAGSSQAAKSLLFSRLNLRLKGSSQTLKDPRAQPGLGKEGSAEAVEPCPLRRAATSLKWIKTALLAWVWFHVNLPTGKAHVPSDQRGHRAQNPRQMCQSHLEEMFLCLGWPLCQHFPLDFMCWISCPSPEEGAPGEKKNSIARKIFWETSLFGLRKFWWYQARFSKVACNYKKKRSHGFVPKSPEVTREMTLDLSRSGLKGMVHYIISTLYCKCLRTLGFLHISQSTGWEALRWQLQALPFSEHHRNVSRP